MTKIIILNKSNMENISLPYISEEELADFYTACAHMPGSTRYHNTGYDGLFLHSVSVADQVSKTRGFKDLKPWEAETLIKIALYHDFNSKVIERKGNEIELAWLEWFRDKYLSRVIFDFMDNELISSVVLTKGVFHPLATDVQKFAFSQFREMLYHNFYQFWQYGHHGFVDGKSLSTIITEFNLRDWFTDGIITFLNPLDVVESITKWVIFVYETARCDSYNAAFSSAQGGEPTLSVQIY